MGWKMFLGGFLIVISLSLWGIVDNYYVNIPEKSVCEPIGENYECTVIHKEKFVQTTESLFLIFSGLFVFVCGGSLLIRGLGEVLP